MQKHVTLVELVKSFPTSIYLQTLASIQPRTSLVKFARSPCTESTTDFIITDPPGPREAGPEAGAPGHQGRAHRPRGDHDRRDEEVRGAPRGRGLTRPRAAACANFWRRGMGRFPRKCKLRGPCGYPKGTLWVPYGYPMGTQWVRVHFAGA